MTVNFNVNSQLEKLVI